MISSSKASAMAPSRAAAPTRPARGAVCVVASSSRRELSHLAAGIASAAILLAPSPSLAVLPPGFKNPSLGAQPEYVEKALALPAIKPKEFKPLGAETVYSADRKPLKAGASAAAVERAEDAAPPIVAPSAPALAVPPKPAAAEAPARLAPAKLQQRAPARKPAAASADAAPSGNNGIAIAAGLVLVAAVGAYAAGNNAEEEAPAAAAAPPPPPPAEPAAPAAESDAPGAP